MKLRMLLFTAMLLVFASLSFGQGFQITLTNNICGCDNDPTMVTVLYTTCGGTVPIPNGTRVDIWWDANNNGAFAGSDSTHCPWVRDAADVQPPVGAVAGTVNEDHFFVDDAQSGVAGTFYSADAIFSSNANQYLPGVNRFYCTINAGGALYVSESVMATAGGTPQDMLFLRWVCCPGGPPPCEPHTSDVTLLGRWFVWPNAQWPNNDPDARFCAKVGHEIGVFTTVHIPVVNVTNMPSIGVHQGCELCGDPNCDPLTGYIQSAWQFLPLVPPFVLNSNNGMGSVVCNFQYVCTIQGTGGCCACITLDYIEPVNFASFGAVAGDNSVSVNWVAASETNLAKYDVVRNGEVIDHVTLRADKTYSYTDARALNGTTYTYKVVGVDVNGLRTESGAMEATPMASLAVITAYDLKQNYPNPFNPTTSITFDVKDENFVTLKVFNAMGQEVSTLANGMYHNGRYNVHFDSKDLTSGLYFYTIKIGNEFSATKKMLLVK